MLKVFSYKIEFYPFKSSLFVFVVSSSFYIIFFSMAQIYKLPSNNNVSLTPKNHTFHIHLVEKDSREDSIWMNESIYKNQKFHDFNLYKM